ncbi:MAG: hypothetical protein WCT16_05110 [Candidatus Buchananbacteria bacterium]|jgi:hypothetical protein
MRYELKKGNKFRVIADDPYYTRKDAIVEVLRDVVTYDGGELVDCKILSMPYKVGGFTLKQDCFYIYRFFEKNNDIYLVPVAYEDEEML